MLSIVKRNSVYYFRQRIPSDVRKHFPADQIMCSLHTGLYRQAKSLAYGKLGALEKVFMTIRTGVLTPEQIQKIVSEYLTDGVDRFETARLNHSPADAEHTQIMAIKDNLILRNMKVLGQGKAFESPMIASKSMMLLNDAGISLKTESVEFKQVCNEVLKAEVELNKTILEHLKGNYDTPYDKKLAEPKSKTLKELIEIYEGEKLASWRDKKKTPNIHRRILHLIGNVRLNAIDRKTCLQFRENLKEYPIKNEDFKTPWKILSKRNPKRLSERTQHDTVVTMTTLFDYAVTMDMGLRGNFAKGLSGTVADCKRIKIREEFNTDELNRMIVALSTINRVETPHYFWLPLILLYTGCRANEACQLRCDDIAEKAFHIWHKPELFQNTKNGKSRVVPVHTALIKLGFLEYVEAQKTAGHDRLFPVLRLEAGKWYKRYSAYFSRNFKNSFLGGYSENELKSKDLHTFRKTFVSWFVGSGLVSTMADVTALQAIVGHTTDDRLANLQEFMGSATLVLNTYSGGFKTDSKKFIEQLNYGIDLTPLNNA